MAPGKLIVFEGTDGSGKGTQFDALADELKRRSIAFETMDFPRYSGSVFGELAGRMLRGDFGSTDVLSSELAVLPFACDRWLLKDDVKKWLAEGKFVLANRYTASSAVYQAAKLSGDRQKAFIQWVYDLEQKTIGLPKEDIVLFLHMPLTLAEKLVEQKDPRAYLGGKKKDMYEENDAIQIAVHHLYMEIARSDEKWKTIECSDGCVLRTPGAIHKDILDVLTANKIL
jgi:dTMP kinase